MKKDYTKILFGILIASICIGIILLFFVLAFMPNIFGEGTYAVTAFLTIVSILVGNILIINAFSKKGWEQRE